MDIRDSYDRANQNEATVEESDRPGPSRSQSGTASRQDSDPAAAPQDTQLHHGVGAVIVNRCQHELRTNAVA